MAIIERYHTVASVLTINRSSSNDIKEGMGIELTTVGGLTEVRRKQSATNTCMGLAGDSYDQDAGNHPYSETVVVSGAGGTRSTQNRVSDMFDETVASDKITVYTGTGEFFTDQYDTARSYDVGEALYCNASGLVTDDSSSMGNQIGRVVAAPSAYPSGVPGVDDTPTNDSTGAINGSTSLGTFLHLTLNVQ
jgi:hypothetical protein